MVSLGKSAPYIRAQTAFAYPEPMALPEPNRAGYEEGVLLPLFYSTYPIYPQQPWFSVTCKRYRTNKNYISCLE